MLISGSGAVLHSLHDEQEAPGAHDPRTRLVAARFKAVMEALGLDLSDPNLADTPLRVARAYRELFAGLEAGSEPELRTFPNAAGYSGLVAVTDIPFRGVWNSEPTNQQ